MRPRLTHLPLSLALSALLLGPAQALPDATSTGLVAQLESTPAFTVGPLRLGMAQADALKILSQPQTVTEPGFEPATALFSKQWLYPDQGIGIILESEQVDAPFTVRSILLEEPSTYEAVSGIKIGMPEAQARELVTSLIAQGVVPFEVGHDQDAGVLFEDAYIVLSVRSIDGVVKHLYLGPGPE